MTKLNRLKSLKSRYDSAQNNLNNVQRRARTRTLIQMGGILNMVGLPQLCGIAEGDDLQLDLENQDKAATLLGMLSHISKSINIHQTGNTEDGDDYIAGLMLNFKELGIKMLKDHVIQKNRT